MPDGSIHSWGWNSDGQANVPNFTQEVIQVAANYNSSYALTKTGEVIYWGPFTNSNQTKTLTDIIQISVNDTAILALDSDKQLFIKGYFDEKFIPDNAINNVEIAAAGANNYIALKTDGSIVTWPAYEDGTNYPQPNFSSTKIISVCAGANHFLALGSDGKVIAWGDNKYNQTDIPEAQNHDVVAIASTAFLNLALRKDGSTFTWGYYPGKGIIPAPQDATNGILGIASGANNLLAIKEDGSVIVWGETAHGQAQLQGLTSLTSSGQINNDPVPIPQRPDGLKIITGFNNSIEKPYIAALNFTTGNFATFGDIVFTPEFKSTYAALSSRSTGIIGLTPYGFVYDSTITSQVHRETLTRRTQGVVRIASSHEQSLGLRADGSVFAWTLFDGSDTVALPAEVSSNISAISAGYYHYVALKKDGSVFCWGNNSYGQLDIPDAAKTGVIAVSAGTTHTVALKNNGTIVAWGSNQYNQSSIPNSPKNQKIVQVYAAGDQNVALNSSGEIFAWGSNAYHQNDIPFAAMENIKYVATGDGFSLAVKDDGRVIVWGDRSQQLSQSNSINLN